MLKLKFLKKIKYMISVKLKKRHLNFSMYQ